MDNGTANDTVSFNYWERYYYTNNTNDQNLTVQNMNMGPLGAWYQMKNKPWPTLALTSFATTIIGLNDQLYLGFVA